MFDGEQAVRGTKVNADERDPFILEYAFDRWSVDIVLERRDEQYPGSLEERVVSDGSLARVLLTCDL